MRNRAIRLQMVNGEPAVDQGVINGWGVSWNPDDNKFYIQVVEGDTVAAFQDWRNAVYYARAHTTQ